MSIQCFESPLGKTLHLGRYPLEKKALLRPWDAADEYLLEYLKNSMVEYPLIINDNFGALSCALAAWQPTLQTDSAIASWSLTENLQNNALDVDQVTTMTSLESHTQVYQLVIVRIPHSLAALEESLIRLKPYLGPDTRVIGGAMAKQIHKSSLALFERIIGPTRTSLAKKKARLIFSQPELSLALTPSPYPSSFALEGTNYRVYNHASVFCRDKLDIGTRLFLQHLPTTVGEAQIVDLGCGNGVVGLIAAANNPKASILFTDESTMAVESARLTFEHSELENATAYRVGDALSGVDTGSVDMVLCNPPFHQQTVVGDAIAWRMFKTAKTVLKKGGQFWVIGNRHLKYHQKLKHLFGNLEQVAANPKFVILKAEKA